MTLDNSSLARSFGRSCGGSLACYTLMLVSMATCWCRGVRADVRLFDPEEEADLAADGSHFASDSDANHLSSWTEWWYFNFHAPNMEGNVGWDGFIVFHTKGDLAADSDPSDHAVKVAVAIWKSTDGSLKYATALPLSTGPTGLQDISGYDASTNGCDVSIQVGGGNPAPVCTVEYDADNDEYTLHVENSAGTLVIDLTYDRISKGFLPDLEGFPDSDWRELFWAVPMPYADVTGTIDLPNVEAKDITDGTGYHDHNWGSWDELDAVWDWGECPVPSDDATIVFGKVDGFGTVGIVVAVDDAGFIAWAENENMDVTYKADASGNIWSHFGTTDYPNVDHVYGKSGTKVIEIQSSLINYLTGSEFGYIAEIMASYSGKVYKDANPADVLLTVSSDTSKGFLEYKDSNGEDDNTAPGAPTNLSATASSCTVVDLSWTAPGGSPSGYNVFRGAQSGGPYLYRGSTANTTYSDLYCKDGTTYYYVVTAYDTVPNEGTASGEASATTLTGCPEICEWPRVDDFWHGVHLPFGPVMATWTGQVIVGNVGPTPAVNVMVQAYYGSPSTGAGLGSSGLNYVGSEYVPYIPPYDEVATGPYYFTPPPAGNDFWEPYWMVLGTAESPTDPFTTGAPWDDNNVSVRNYWEIAAQAGEPAELHFWMENSSSEPALMELAIDRSSCPAAWAVDVTPAAGMELFIPAGQIGSLGTLTVVPTGSTAGSVSVVQTQYDLGGEVVRVAGGLSLGITATGLGDTNGDDLVNLVDYQDFHGCLSGPAGGEQYVPPSQRCAAVFDFNGDGDVDSGDFGGFQTAFTGP